MAYIPKHSPTIRQSGRNNKQFIFIIIITLIIAAIVIALFIVNPFKDNTNSDTANNATEIVTASDTNTEKPQKEDTRLVRSTSDNKKMPSEHVCYLTFDDGPSGNTERILDILDKYNIKATWFVKANNNAVGKSKTIWDKGHQVAVHTFTHEYRSIYASSDAFWKDYNKAYSTLENTLGFKPANMFRFPGGSTNSYNTKIAKSLMNQAESKKIHFFDWNQSCGDGATHTSDELVMYATRGGEKLNSVCLLMHDSDAKNTTVEALERIIQFYKNQGFSFDYLNEECYNYKL